MIEVSRDRPGRAGSVAAALALAALALAAPNWAAADSAAEDHETARALREAGAIVPLEKVVAEASARHDGHLLEVELKRREGDRKADYVYEVEFVDAEGVVWKMYFDARTGALIESDREND
jgi:uncharacterized membrane protein YkoI